ncbi:hypothetical protein AgCh_006391 [Apium graveolens]
MANLFTPPQNPIFIAGHSRNSSVSYPGNVLKNRLGSTQWLESEMLRLTHLHDRASDLEMCMRDKGSGFSRRGREPISPGSNDINDSWSGERNILVLSKVGSTLGIVEHGVECRIYLHMYLFGSLPEDECHYAIYDYDFVTVENWQKSRIFFIEWLLDNDELSPHQVNDVKDYIDDYAEHNQEDFDEFSDIDELYISLPLEKVKALKDLVMIPHGLVKVEFSDEKLQDNSYWAKYFSISNSLQSGAEIEYSAKAQEVLGQVRGRHSSVVNW